MPHPRHGGPRAILLAAGEALADAGLDVEAISPMIATQPLGPSRRRYANAAAIVSTQLGPEGLLDLLRRIEHGFGRRRSGQGWRQRVLDLDIVLWSGGSWASEHLVIPHRQFRNRDFVLGPARVIAPGWRDPVTGRTVRQLHARLTRARALP